MRPPVPPPERSLPSYDEPTPETRRRMTREEEAEFALTNTCAAPEVIVLIVVLMLLTIVSVPLVELVAKRRLPGAELLGAFAPGARLPGHFLARLPTSAAIKAAEKNLESESVVSQFLLPRVQSFLTGVLGAGNEQAYPGHDGWIFYRPDVDYVLGTPFFDPNRMHVRARDLGIQPDPVKAIVDFQRQLAVRGIQLLVVPVPVKPQIDPEMLARGAQSRRLLANASRADFLRRLGEEKILVLDAGAVLAARKDGRLPIYLQTDTHWAPPAMEELARLAAQALADGPPRDSQYKVAPQSVSNLGDIATMLKLPHSQRIFAPQTVEIHQVQAGNALWRPSADSQVLLLGDSFSNIYSLAPMGWGESAGFAEHLSESFHQPLDCILRNSDGAFATREILSRELARGRDRLAGKKYVIWEFAERELAIGDWKLLPMKLGEPHPATFFVPKEGETVSVEATVAEVTAVPRPGTVPYADHILSLHLVDVTGPALDAGKGSVEALAYLWSMRGSVWTPAARLRPGDHVKLRLTAWPGDHPERSQFNRSEFTDAALQLEEPAWGELE